MDVLQTVVVPIVYIVLGVLLVWLVIEIILTIRKVRNTIRDLGPTIQNVDAMVKDLQPSIKQVDPILDRATLTIDSVNLELMRVDEILSNVTQITSGVSKAASAVDNVTSAPLDLVTSLTDKVRTRLRPRYASEQSQQMGGVGQPQATNPIVDFADAATDSVAEAIKDTREKSAARREAADHHQDEAKQRKATLDSTSSNITQKLSHDVSDDSAIG